MISGETLFHQISEHVQNSSDKVLHMESSGGIWEFLLAHYFNHSFEMTVSKQHMDECNMQIFNSMQPCNITINVPNLFQ